MELRAFFGRFVWRGVTSMTSQSFPRFVDQSHTEGVRTQPGCTRFSSSRFPGEKTHFAPTADTHESSPPYLLKNKMSLKKFQWSGNPTPQTTLLFLRTRHNYKN